MPGKYISIGDNIRETRGTEFVTIKTAGGIFPGGIPLLLLFFLSSYSPFLIYQNSWMYISWGNSPSLIPQEKVQKEQLRPCSVFLVENTLPRLALLFKHKF